MHIDGVTGCLKCIIYLNHVGERNGPFCYVPGSNRLKMGAFDAIVRRTVDRAGFATSEPAMRQLFMALPAFARRKGSFGDDLLDGSPNAERLLRAEIRFTSNLGNVAAFDNLGIHRGGLVQEGERRAIFAVIA
jgi:hypothetical protein